MSFTPGMPDSAGSFEKEKPANGVKCRKCEEERVTYRTWESSCGGWEDDQFTCQACGHSWWVEGIDS